MRKLAREHNARIYFDTRWQDAFATPMFREIHTSPLEDHGWCDHLAMLGLGPLRVTEAVCYFTGLHEIGHIACEHSMFAPPEDVALEHEAEAWEWAFANSAIAPTPEVISYARDAMESYHRTSHLSYRPERFANTLHALRQASC